MLPGKQGKLHVTGVLNWIAQAVTNYVAYLYIY